MEEYTLEMTCGACPEQYDVYKDEEVVGYLRLRHGYFYASCPWSGGEKVYEAHPKGDGMFEDDERDYYLTRAIAAIDRYYKPQDEPKQKIEAWGTRADLEAAGYKTFNVFWEREMIFMRSDPDDEAYVRRIWNEAVEACASLTHSFCIDHPCPVQERIEELIVEEPC